VTGIVKPHNPASPNLEFEVNLPAAWNRRVLQMGGGGYNGSLVTGLTGFTLQPANVDNPLKQGFVTIGTDGGHQAPPGFNGSFGMDDEALRNFGKESVKKGHDAAMEVVKKAYGRAPERWYFIGGSQGGHEALDAAARYPNDYEAQVGQGAVTFHSEERLAATDRGVVMFRRRLRAEIEAVGEGRDPSGVTFDPARAVVAVQAGNFLLEAAPAGA